VVAEMERFRGRGHAAINYGSRFLRKGT